MLPCLLTLTLAVALAVEVDDAPYCALRYRRLCQGKGYHVACQFSTPGPGESCQNYTKIEFTKELRYFITHYINRRRQRLASGNERARGGAMMPKPEIMMQVDWDRELSFLAQRLADQCIFVHDDCRATVRYPYAGQTVGEVKMRGYTDMEDVAGIMRAIRRVLDAWWGEKRRVQPKQLISPFRLSSSSKGSVWGHFTQLAVWNLRGVGCGAVRHGAEHPRLLLVCDFSHTNMLGQRTLTPGPLAACPVHTVRRPRSPYPLLCAPIRTARNDSPERSDEEPFYYDADDEGYDGADDVEDDYSDEDTGEEKTTDAPETVTRRPTLRAFVKDYEDESDNVRRLKSSSGRTVRKLGRQTPRYKHAQIPSSFPRREKLTYVRRRTSPARLYEEVREHREGLHTNNDIGIERYSEEPLKVIGLHEISEAAGIPTAVRQRWKQTRNRPIRPGATALVSKLYLPRARQRDLVVPQKQVSPRVPARMDDDEDQMYKDTGFKPRGNLRKTNRQM